MLAAIKQVALDTAFTILYIAEDIVEDAITWLNSHQ